MENPQEDPRFLLWDLSSLTKLPELSIWYKNRVKVECVCIYIYWLFHVQSPSSPGWPQTCGVILLPLPPECECWDHRPVSLRLAVASCYAPVSWQDLCLGLSCALGLS